MPTMGKYCKAYPAARFREFPGWSERAVAVEDGVVYLFLQENLVVTKDVFLSQPAFLRFPDGSARTALTFL